MKNKLPICLLLLCSLPLLAADRNVIYDYVTVRKGLIFGATASNGVASSPVTITNNGAITTNDFLTATIVSDFNGAQPPLLGFEDWVLLNSTVTEKGLLTVMTNMIRAGYRDAGYNSILIDEGWTTNRDGSGNLVAKASWPSGIRGVIQNLHTNGFKVGMFFSLGNAGVVGPGSRNYIERDATNAAAWGLDFVHLVVDDFSYDTGNGNDPNLYLYKRFIKALQSSGKKILVYGTGHGFEPWQQGAMDAILHAGWTGYADANGSWTNTLGFIDGFNSRKDFVRPGHYLFHGWLAWNYRANTVDATENPWQTQALYGMLSMWNSPLFIANAYADAVGYEWIGKIQTNRLMLSIDQDALAVPPVAVFSNNAAQIFYKPLAPAGGGRFAVALLSRDLTTGSKTFSVVWTNFAVAPLPTSQTYTLTDVFGLTNSTVTTNGFTYTVPTNGLALFIVEPPSTSSSIAGQAGPVYQTNFTFHAKDFRSVSGMTYNVGTADTVGEALDGTLQKIAVPFPSWVTQAVSRVAISTSSQASLHYTNRLIAWTDGLKQQAGQEIIGGIVSVPFTANSTTTTYMLATNAWPADGKPHYLSVDNAVTAATNTTGLLYIGWIQSIVTADHASITNGAP